VEDAVCGGGWGGENCFKSEFDFRVDISDWETHPLILLEIPVYFAAGVFGLHI
jgi:hypothetical protein